MRKAICLFLLAAFPLFAMAEAEDAPGRVARLSLTEGEVSLAPAGTEEWADAVLNRPLTSGDRIWVDKDARAELQVGSAAVHLDHNSGFSFEQLDDDVMRMSLTDGSATVRVSRKLESETIEVATPNATVTLLHPGEYHIEVNEAGDQSIVKVRSGEAAVTGDKDSYVVRANEATTFKGTKELLADTSTLPQRTAFENWANDRDRREERSKSAQYVSRDVVGYEDLDDDGDWISEPEYGYVWTPRYVHAGWAPYRDGRWAWVSPWGWTWIDNTRWGYAPFHYGRWAYLSHRSRWGWIPGPRHVRPIYAPALVAWVGSPGVSVSVGIGSGVGWFPLGPREVYVPGYWHSRRYIHNVNVTNTVIINNTYINDAYRGRRDRIDYRYRHQPNAVTIVSRDSFAGGRSIGGHVTNVNARDLRRWNHDSRPPAIAPVHDSVFAGNRTQTSTERSARFARAERPAALRDQRAGYSGRVPFDTERRAIEANGGRPVTRSQLFTSNPRDRGESRGTRAVQSLNGATVRQSVPRSASESAARNELDAAREQRGSRDAGSSRNAGGDRPQWRDGGYRNRGAGEQSAAPEVAAAGAAEAPRTEANTAPRNSGFARSGRSQEDAATSRRETARQEALTRSQGSTPSADDSARRNAWRTSPERMPRNDAEPAPSFNSVPRAQREERSSPRFEQQREARQYQPRASEPAQRPIQQQAAPERSSRGGGERSGGDRSGVRSGGGESKGGRNFERQSQK